MPRKKEAKRLKADANDSAEEADTAPDYTAEEKARVHFEIGEHSQIGTMHAKNEDAFVQHEFETCWFFAVMDGHSAKEQGTEASQYASKTLHWEMAKHLDKLSLEECFREAFVETDRKFSLDAEKRSSDSGCCVVACIMKGRHLTIGHAGDCRAVFYDTQVHQLTSDHNYSSMPERKRVEDLGGYFMDGRIFGELEPTRGFGDVEIRRAHIDMLLSFQTSKDKESTTTKEAETSSSSSSSSATTTHAGSTSMARTAAATKRHASKLTSCPVPLSFAELQALTSVTELDPQYAIVSPQPVVTHHIVPVSEEGSFLVLASDGIWSSLTNQKVCEIVKQNLTGKHAHGVNRAQIAARAICEAASASPLSYDDITAIVVWFKN